ncbi:MAG: hypothetical protein F6K19_24835 [Cyanothece sp. SIO1E1]|nr:hypothetical protein [Cyanothece sp. SIO1E1]
MTPEPLHQGVEPIADPALSKLLEIKSDMAAQEADLIAQLQAIREKRSSLEKVIEMFSSADVPAVLESLTALHSTFEIPLSIIEPVSTHEQDPEVEGAVSQPAERREDVSTHDSSDQAVIANSLNNLDAAIELNSTSKPGEIITTDAPGQIDATLETPAALAETPTDNEKLKTEKTKLELPYGFGKIVSNQYEPTLDRLLPRDADQRSAYLSAIIEETKSGRDFLMKIAKAITRKYKGRPGTSAAYRGLLEKAKAIQTA